MKTSNFLHVPKKILTKKSEKEKNSMFYVPEFKKKSTKQINFGLIKFFIPQKTSIYKKNSKKKLQIEMS